MQMCWLARVTLLLTRNGVKRMKNEDISYKDTVSQGVAWQRRVATCESVLSKTWLWSHFLSMSGLYACSTIS